MPTRVVTISHTTGAGGEAIGRTVADRLGFRYLDEEIITLAAQKEGVDAELVADTERRKGFLARLFAGLSGSRDVATIEFQALVAGEVSLSVEESVALGGIVAKSPPFGTAPSFSGASVHVAVPEPGAGALLGFGLGGLGLVRRNARPSAAHRSIGRKPCGASTCSPSH